MSQPARPTPPAAPGAISSTWSSFDRISQVTALARLKRTSFTILTLLFVRYAFPPYLAVRRRYLDIIAGHSAPESINRGLNLIYWLVILMNAAICAHGYYRYSWSPLNIAAAPPKPLGPSLPVPRQSSPITRAGPSPELLKSISATSTSSPLRHSSSITRRAGPSTPGNPLQTPTRQTPGALSTPGSAARASPGSSYAARVFNLSQETTPSKTGLFYEKEPPAQNQGHSQGQGTAPGQSQALSGGQGAPGPGGDYVFVDRNEQEWVDNVWKGVRAKSGKLGR